SVGRTREGLGPWTLRLWDRERGSATIELSSPFPDEPCLTFSEDERVLYVAAEVEAIDSWELPAATRRPRISAPLAAWERTGGLGVRDLFLAPDGRDLILHSEGGLFRTIANPTGAILHRRTVPGLPTRGGLQALDGRAIIVPDG